MESDFVPSATTMEPKAESIIKKVPGKILPIPSERSATNAELSKKRTFDLQELLERQKKILSNRLLLNKLPDKGARAQELKDRIEHELKSRDHVDEAASLFSQIRLGQLNELEWTGHCSPGQIKCKASNKCDPLSEETDPLKIIASHSGTMAQNKQISFLAPDQSLIKPDDLIDSSFGNTNSSTPGACTNRVNGSLRCPESPTGTNFNRHQDAGCTEDGLCPGESSLSGLYTCLTLQTTAFDEPERFAYSICERFGHKETKERFKLNKPVKQFSGTKPTRTMSAEPRIWMETNVTPPPLIYNNAKLLSLEESLEVQRKQNIQLKAIQTKHAAERLSTLHGIQMSGKDIPSSVVGSMAYRRYAPSDSDSDDEVNETELEEQELHDEDQVDRGTTVVYNVES